MQRAKDLPREGNAMPQGKHVLVVEDDPTGRAALALILSHVGHDVRCAADGEEALEELRVHRPDVVLLDLLLPRVDGWEFRRRQQQDPDLAGVPVVVLSGGGPTRRLGEPLGDVTWLPKPVEFDRLLDAIEHATGPGLA
jgi:CheY-like chemotaxis protein